MKVRWTESGLADLRDVEASIARHSVQYSRGMVERIFGRCKLLEAHPRLGAIVPEFEDESLRELFEGPYRIVYRVGDGQVEVLAVVHAARKLPRGF